MELIAACWNNFGEEPQQRRTDTNSFIDDSLSLCKYESEDET
jgi:hypothetical protein